jgi:hypothetical protein
LRRRLPTGSSVPLLVEPVPRGQPGGRGQVTRPLPTLPMPGRGSDENVSASSGAGVVVRGPAHPAARAAPVRPSRANRPTTSGRVARACSRRSLPCLGPRQLFSRWARVQHQGVQAREASTGSGRRQAACGAGIVNSEATRRRAHTP